MRDMQDDDTKSPAPPPAAAAAARRAAGQAAPDASALRDRFAKLAQADTPEAATDAAAAAADDEVTRIRALIDEMRPTFRRDGGDIELVRVEGAKVIVHLSGACAGCMLAGQTLYGVQKRITDILGRPFRVIPDIRH
ncbi:NifU family protein [Rhodobacter capsulatus]|uniref:NifU family protein n=1 Tax=Rhodobacter capsulatus TaxID=1061 RepID=UPI0011416EAF|nr:NifU family protein [Rhodobacter capsulatus]TQD33243.1 NifU family protein [Rhodobacter capsulatus]